MSFFGKITNVFDDVTSKAKKVFQTDEEKLNAKKLLNKIIMEFILRDDVIEKMVKGIYEYTKMNLFDPTLARLKDGELDNYFDEMLLVDYFLQNNNLQKYIEGNVTKNTKLIEAMVSKLSKMLVKLYDSLLDSKENIFEKIEAVQKHLLEEGLNELNSTFDEIKRNTIKETRNIPKKFLTDEIDNLSCSFESIMMTSLAAKELVKEDFLNIAQILIKNGAINEQGQFNVKMLEGIQPSGKELIPFVVLSRLSDKEKEVPKENKSGIFGGFDFNNAFNQVKSTMKNIGESIQNKDLSEFGKNVSQMKNQFSVIYANVKGIQKAIETLADIDFGKYAQYKDMIINFCKNFYNKIEEFVTKNLDIRKLLFKFIEIAILTKIFECFLKVFETKEMKALFGEKIKVVKNVITKLKDEKVEEQKK